MSAEQIMPQEREQIMPRSLPRPFGQNNLIFTLSLSDRALIEPYLHLVSLKASEVLEEANTPVKTVYFPTSGIGSTAAFNKGRCIEVGLFGYEGMSGTSVVMQGTQTSQETFMQVTGEGLAIKAGKLATLLEQSPSLEHHLLQYVQALMTQMAHTALANGQANIEERLARWLLMCHDRVRGDRIELTHKFLSVMLGVRRAGVTVATHVLEGKGLILANRGEIIILNRQGLEAAAQESYGVPEAEYARLIGARFNKGSSARLHGLDKRTL